MLFASSFLHKAFAARRALVGFAACVKTLVLGARPPAAEGPGTMLTCKRFAAAVDEHVLAESCCGGELPFTDVTSHPFPAILTMQDSYMPQKTGFQFKGSWATRTWKSLLAMHSLHMSLQNCTSMSSIIAQGAHVILNIEMVVFDVSV